MHADGRDITVLAEALANFKSHPGRKSPIALCIKHGLLDELALAPGEHGYPFIYCAPSIVEKMLHGPFHWKEDIDRCSSAQALMTVSAALEQAAYPLESYFLDKGSGGTLIPDELRHGSLTWLGSISSTCTSLRLESEHSCSQETKRILDSVSAETFPKLRSLHLVGAVVESGTLPCLLAQVSSSLRELTISSCRFLQTEAWLETLTCIRDVLELEKFTTHSIHLLKGHSVYFVPNPYVATRTTEASLIGNQIKDGIMYLGERDGASICRWCNVNNAF